MAVKLHLQTVSPLLESTLRLLMNEPALDSFRLVGGTALSLQRGHRMSVDIDLFSDALYGSVNFDEIELFLKKNFSLVEMSKFSKPVVLGNNYFVGHNANELLKLDIYYNEPFIFPAIEYEGIRLASVEEIIAMKMDVIQRTGRKKDFWDIHELHTEYTLKEMLDLHEQRYPHIHNRKLLIEQLINFTEADYDFEPDCLRGKHWELIKLDLIDFKNTIN
jgi:hypothetical protein